MALSCKASLLAPAFSASNKPKMVFASRLDSGKGAKEPLRLVARKLVGGALATHGTASAEAFFSYTGAKA